MVEPLIIADNITMRFNMAREKTDSIKEHLLRRIKGKIEIDEFFALRDINFRVNEGESLALVGRNGSGKSTMLKIIAGVLAPTVGTVKVNGDIAPLIELGAGFDFDLTARENVFLNGAVLGYSREQMRKKFDEIIDFAELGEFVDVPVKNYSSGMVARLGFSIATAVPAKVLIVDEILSVGDFAFQQKCHKRMENMLGNGTTLLLVSHNADQVKALCKRAIWLDHGKLMMDGDSVTVCDAYIGAQ